jgi:hypothetical protein
MKPPAAPQAGSPKLQAAGYQSGIAPKPRPVFGFRATVRSPRHPCSKLQGILAKANKVKLVTHYSMSRKAQKHDKDRKEIHLSGGSAGRP